MVNKADNSRGHVFFVDDEGGVCAAVKEALEESNINVLCFTHPSECLAQLRSNPCDLLIADIRMPEKDGIQLLREVKEFAPSIPVLLITGYGDIPTAVKAIKYGAVDFIEKPMGKHSLVQKVKAILDQKRIVIPDGFRALTRMEMQVLSLIVIGKSNKEIAQTINRTVRTVESHRARLMRKLGVHSLVDLLKVAAAVGLVDLRSGPGLPLGACDTDERLGDMLETG